MTIKNTASSTPLYPYVSVINYKSTTGGYPVMYMSNARGSEVAPSALQANDLLGGLLFQGRTDTTFRQAAQIHAIADGNFAGESFPTSLAISTGGTSGLSERMRINASGNVGIGTTAPSNALEVAGSIKSTSGGYKFPDGTMQTTMAGITGCPSGMTMVSADPSNGFVAYCIDSSNSAGVGANDGQIACQNAGKHMCRAQELYRASVAIAVSCTTALWNGDGLNFWNGIHNFANYTAGASCNSNGWAPMGNTYPYRGCR